MKILNRKQLEAIEEFFNQGVQKDIDKDVDKEYPRIWRQYNCQSFEEVVFYAQLEAQARVSMAEFREGGGVKEIE